LLLFEKHIYFASTAVCSGKRPVSLQCENAKTAILFDLA